MTSLYDELEKKLQDSNARLMSLPLQFLRAITCDFSIEYELGRGGYGVVYKGVLQSGKIIAVKKLFEIHLLDDKTFQKEVSCLKEIKHQHVVQLIGYCAESSWELIDQPSGRSIWAEIPKRFLCFEYVCNKSLDKYISVSMDESSALGWYMRYETIKGICVGLKFLHEECHIVHLDLKPENILMDASMIPKIADFGLSRIFGTQQSRIVTDNRAGSRGYMAPEYLIKGVVSMKADIFSLGAIIIEIITGQRDYPYFQLDDPQSTVTSCQHFIEKVLEMWRNKFESTLKYVTTESYIQQVRQCVTVALKCVNPDMEKRPTAKEIVQVLNEVEQMEANSELPSEIWCKETSLVLDTTVNKEFIPHSTVEDLANIETNGIVEDVNKAQDCLSRIPSGKSATYSQNDEEPAKESSEPKQASDKTSEYTDKLLVQNSNASKDVTPTSVTKDMFNNEIDGKDVDEATSESFSPGPSSELSKDNQNYQEAVTESNEPQLASVTTAEVSASSSELLDVHPLELIFPVEPNKSITCSLYLTNNQDKWVVFRLMEKRYNWMCFLKLPMYGIVPPRSTYRLIVSTGKKVSLPTETEVDLILQTFTSDQYITPYKRGHDWDLHFKKAIMSEIAVHMVALKAIYAQNGKTSYEVIPGSSTFLDVHPLELCFSFEPNKLIPCLLNLTNNTAERVAFRLLKKGDEQTCFISSLPMFSVVDPGTTYTLAVIMNKHENLPQERAVDITLNTSKYYEVLCDDQFCRKHFQNAEELGYPLHKVTLKVVCALQGQTLFESIPPSIKIISVEDKGGSYISAMDANQTEPLIITSSYRSSVDIWNSDTQKSMGSIYISKEASAVSVKFLERKGWFLVGSSDGFIHVYNYMRNMKKIKSIKAYDPKIYSLAIHPTKSYVLSALSTQIKLWDWDHRFRWKCMRTFMEHSNHVCALAFNPEDYKSFASASRDRSIKVWSLDSSISRYTLSGHSGCVNSVDFFTHDGQQYLITGSDDETAKIWDMQKKECVRTLPHRSAVLSVLPHPKLPVLVTGTKDGRLYIWSSVNFRFKRILNIGGLSDLKGLACFNESGRVVVAHRNGLSVIEIGDEEEQGLPESWPASSLAN